MIAPRSVVKREILCTVGVFLCGSGGEIRH